MSDNLPPPLEYQVYDPDRNEIRVETIQPSRRPYWLHALLFVLTILSTLCIGAYLQRNFDQHVTMMSMGRGFFEPWTWALADWRRLALGIPFSLSLLGILTAHELGHYILCVRRGVYASWPYFIPAPTLIGTFGAFIRIKSPIRSRDDLFDIGIAGPIAGFVVAVPVLLLGLWASRPMIGLLDKDTIFLGWPPAFHVGQWILSALGSHSSGASYDLSALSLHPVAIAAWVGMFATSLNLLPGGQLDGGHIVFALNPRAHSAVSRLAIVALIPLAWFGWAGWIIWAIVIRLTGHHPDVPESPRLGGRRRLVAVLGLLIFALTFTWNPIQGSLGDVVNEAIDYFLKK
ncbi:MAG TPA: site-2 protease family protein [Candidatus Saccharimonadales bacterium]|jgi:membrane-associated protease RseP (regulator of RpoE activity)|nr:site-2 protease family protein [Candidatus Saccharimonadales bacterium]